MCVVLSGANFNLTGKKPQKPPQGVCSLDFFNGTPPHWTSAVLPPGCSATLAKIKQKKNLPLQQKCPLFSPQKPRGTYHRHLTKAPLALFSARLWLVLPSPTHTHTHTPRGPTHARSDVHAQKFATFPAPCGVGHPLLFLQQHQVTHPHLTISSLSALHLSGSLSVCSRGSSRRLHADLH